MSYIECKFHLEPFEPYNDIIVAQLSEFNFESFIENDQKEVLAYIKEEDFTSEVESFCKSRSFDNVDLTFVSKLIPKENWNQKWEDSFEPVEIEDFCVIRAPFHELEKVFKHEIIIEPKMSFGTGHHATTQLMVKSMNSLEVDSSEVLDMGSGTGVLAILADKMNAKHVDAIDIEEWAFENIQENIERNSALRVKSHLGGAEVLSVVKNSYDIILANINKNILLRDISLYNNYLKDGGDLLLSGFFVYDTEEMKEYLASLNYKFIKSSDLDEWVCLHFKKN